MPTTEQFVQAPPTYAWGGNMYAPNAIEAGVQALPMARPVGGGAGMGAGLSKKKGGLPGAGFLSDYLKKKGIKSSLSGKQAGLLGAGGMLGGAIGDKIAQKHAKTGGAISGLSKGASTGAMIGSFFPGPGTLIGAGIGGVAGALKGLFGGKKKNKEKKAALAAQKQAGLSSISPGQGWSARPLGPVVQSDPYGQLRAETEARYRPTATPFTPPPVYTPPMRQSTNPWDGGEIGGGSSWGG